MQNTWTTGDFENIQYHKEVDASYDDSRIRAL